VDSDKVGLVIGTGGETLKSLQRQTGASIKFDSDAGAFNVRGSPHEVKLAKGLILSMVENPLIKTKIPRTRLVTSRILVPTDKVGLIIGKGGANVKAMKADTGVSVYIDNDAETSNSQEKWCIIKGNFAAVEQAKEAIKLKIGQLDGASATSQGLTTPILFMES
jgi:polyribonucleotide nucleotidyltransferase